ncbi:MAG: homoserine dehydrogenase [Candidatus Hydrogenedentota bacterium]|nr:MAG: homoserine dehydrogenase [Candidatus Hydrogenedentota bacterium]
MPALFRNGGRGDSRRAAGDGRRSDGSGRLLRRCLYGRDCAARGGREGFPHFAGGGRIWFRDRRVQLRGLFDGADIGVDGGGSRGTTGAASEGGGILSEGKGESPRRGRNLRIGLIGCGVVGGGVAELLLDSDRPWEKDGVRLHLVRVADLKFPRGSRIPAKIRTHRIEDIIADPSIDVVVELVGGTGVANEIATSALSAGKDVVTANKALLAERGEALFRLAGDMGREIAFEAAVGGGIPVLQNLLADVAANRFDTVYGILNGTTNYILTRMTEENLSFEDALSEAQQLGFAEADPTLDVEGVDAAHKIQLLAALAFGRRVAMKKIPTKGIRRVAPLDIEYAAQLGCVIKLLAVARMVGSGLEMSVAPTLITREHPVAGISREINAVFLSGNRVGELLLVGRGAGRYPTASAVVGDLIRLAQDPQPRYVRRMLAARPCDPLPPSRYRSRYYLRLTAVERPGVLAKVTGILGRHEISIASVVQLEAGRTGRKIPVALLTHETTAERLRKAVKEINRLDVIKGRTVVFPMVT